MAARPRILLLENDPDTRRLHAERLGGDGLRVIESADVDASLAVLGRRAIDIAVLEAPLGGPGPLHLLSRAHRVSGATDILLIAHRSAAVAALQALRLGASDCLVRPFRPETLLASVRQLLAGRRIRRSHPELDHQLVFYSALGRLGHLAPASLPAAALEDTARVCAASAGVYLATGGKERQPEVLAELGLPPARGSQLAHLFSTLSTAGSGHQRAAIFRPRTGPLAEVREHWARELGETIVVGVRHPGDERGLLALFRGHRAPALAATALAELELLAAQVGHALGTAAALGLEASEEEIDPLTEVFSAQALGRILDEEVRRVVRGGPPFALLDLDLDGFRGLNDRHGHLLSSGVLRELCRIVCRCVRDADVVARVGADEFAVLVCGSDARAARGVAERAQLAVQSHVFLAREQLRLRTSVSVGIAGCPEHSRSGSELLALAQAATAEARRASHGGGLALASTPV